MRLRVIPTGEIECSDEEYSQLIDMTKNVINGDTDTYQNHGIAAIFAQIKDHEKSWWSWTKFDDYTMEEYTIKEFEQHVMAHALGPFTCIKVPGFLGHHEYHLYFDGKDIKQISDTLAVADVMCD